MKMPGVTVAIATLVLSVPAIAKPKTPAPCTVYFAVAEHDEITVGLTMNGVNKAQNSWYAKHGDRDKSAGICYVAKVTDAPISAPLYLVIWGEHEVDRPYTFTDETTETETGTVSGTATDNEGNTTQIEGTTTTEVPIEETHSGVRQSYVADGWLAVWNATANGPVGKGKGNFVPVAPLHSHAGALSYLAPVVADARSRSTASVSLLKDAMDQIRQRESRPAQ